MSKLKPPGVTIKITDCSEIDSSAPTTFMCSPHGPVILNSPEEIDDLNGEPRGTTRKVLRATGLRRITAIGRIKVPHRNLKTRRKPISETNNNEKKHRW